VGCPGRLRALRRAGESYIDLILRLAEIRGAPTGIDVRAIAAGVDGVRYGLRCDTRSGPSRTAALREQPLRAFTRTRAELMTLRNRELFLGQEFIRAARR
jgi:hypothetical protein